jgi:hypothetical protein
MVDWRDFFPSWILERGYSYFINGHVTSYEEIGDGFHGTVSGTEDYSVFVNDIENNHDDDFHMDCTCPYADDKPYCKHMAALLYTIEAQKHPDKSISTAYDNELNKLAENIDSLYEVIEVLPLETIKNELINILESDNNLRAGFLLKYNRSDRSISAYIRNMHDTARTIRYECSDHRGFVNWKNASTYVSRLINEVIDRLYDLISDDGAGAKTAFDVSLFVLDLYADTSVDDSGQTQFIIDECISLWKEIYSYNENDRLRRHMFNELLSQCDKIGLGEYIPDRIDDFIAEFFNDGSLATDRLKILDERIKRFSSDDSWHGQYMLSQSVMERLALMAEMGEHKTEMDAFKEMYWRLPSIRELKMKELEQSGETADLIHLLIMSKEVDGGYPGLVSKYSKKLIECYKNSSSIDMLKSELLTYITAYSNGDVGAFLELKQCYSNKEEWIKVREGIFDILIKSRVDIKPLLAVEGLKDRLFELITRKRVSSRGFERFVLQDIRKYGDKLRPEYNNELLDMHYELINKMSEFAGGRGYYREIVAAIRYMLDYPGGKERVREMLGYWRTRYANRPAMREELQVLHRDLQ